ncbi:MAG: hypothetical protein WDZ29_07480 [Balneolaceae bacterium]
MKRSLPIILIFLFGITLAAEAQFREDLSRTTDFTGAVLKAEHPAHSNLGLSNLMDALNMSMSHSYSMTFSGMGGQFQNLNAYTNHMRFDLSEKLTGNVDLSLLHSPFGNSYMNMGMGGNSPAARVIVDRAELNYQISPNASFSIQFSQRPSYSPYGYFPGSFYGGRNHSGY